MTVTYGFFNSIDHDRVYDATDFSKVFDGIINDGVFMSVGNALLVSPTTGMTVSVGVGRAWFDHTWTYNDTVLNLTLDASHVTLNRIDAIVLEVNSSEGVRANSIKIVKGSDAGSPVRPTLTNTASIHQHALAYISVPHGLTTITGAQITIIVGTVDCPYVTGILATVNASSLLAQWESEFTQWFDEMKDQLSEDAAGNLQLEINDRPQLTKKQGGSSTNWSIPGTANFDLPSNPLIQVGTGQIALDNGETRLQVTFPIAFKALTTPMVIAIPYVGSHTLDVTCEITYVDPSMCVIYAVKHTTVAPYHALPPVGTVIFWMAIGIPTP